MGTVLLVPVPGVNANLFGSTDVTRSLGNTHVNLALLLAFYLSPVSRQIRRR